MSFLAEVEALKKSPMPEVRSTIAAKVSDGLNSGAFDGNEIAIATDILRLLSHDAELRVRKTVAECLKSNPSIPHDIMFGLANDDIEVANPVLECSSVLTDGDLIEIIRSTQHVAKLVAISRRNNLPEVVSTALTYTRNNEVVESLFVNKTAKISEECIRLVMDEFKNNGGIMVALMDRGDLPVSIAEKLINHASGKIREKLIREYSLSINDADRVMRVSQEKATLNLLEEEAQPETSAGIYIANVENVSIKPSKTEQLVRHLKAQGRLTQSLVLRSLCEGNLKFFEASMAILAGTTVQNAKTLIKDKNPTALNALCKRAGIPVSIIQAMQVIVEFIHNEEKSGNLNTPGFKQRLLENILSNNYDRTVPLMPYMVAIISSKIETGDLV